MKRLMAAMLLLGLGQVLAGALGAAALMRIAHRTDGGAAGGRLAQGAGHTIARAEQWASDTRDRVFNAVHYWQARREAAGFAAQGRNPLPAPTELHVEVEMGDGEGQ